MPLRRRLLANHPRFEKLASLPVVALTALVGVVLVFSVYASGPAPSLPEKPQEGPLQPYKLGFAPYHYIPWTGSLTEARTATGANTLVAAFMLSSGGCTPAWDGEASLGLGSLRGKTIAADIDKLRVEGGDVVLSFGGAQGTELAVSCTDPEKLKLAYRSVIDTYKLDKLDFDLEGATAADAAASARRATALAQLQQDLPHLRLWATLQVTPDGLTPQAVAVLTDLRDAGVQLAGVNIMIMNYGVGSQQMGDTGVRAATATVAQMAQLYPGSSEADRWKGLGLTAMIGRNDTAPETFTVDNAKQIHELAIAKDVGLMSYWSASRDQSCPAGAPPTGLTCSGVEQLPYEFARQMSIPTK